MGHLITMPRLCTAALCILVVFPKPATLLIHEEKMPRAAVIGGGIGGTATAYFLRQLFGPGKLHIDLYERNQIGGRLAVVDVGGQSYEMGGSIIHPRNKYMTSFAKKFGLKYREAVSESRMGLWDGSEFLFEESSWESVTMLKLLWRYGVGPLKLRFYIDDMLGKFEKIYSLQNKGETYSNVDDLLKAMDSQFGTYQHVKTSDGFKKEGFSDHMIDEIISATLRVNYGQNNSVHQFVGSVSVAGATGNLLAIKGGNFQVPEKLLEASDAQVIRDRVLKVSPSPHRRKLVVQRQGSSSSEDNTDLSRHYDFVILAAPIISNADQSVDLSAFSFKALAGPYHHTISTILQGHLNHSFFGFQSQDSIPDEIIVTKDGPFFNSISRVYPVNMEGGSKNKSDVWKVFSSSDLTDEQLKSLFTQYSPNSIQVKDWLAYPQYSEVPKSNVFHISDNFYYLNSIEWAASAMEMSVIGAKNVALLAHKGFLGNLVQPTKSSKTVRSLQTNVENEL